MVNSLQHPIAQIIIVFGLDTFFYKVCLEAVGLIILLLYLSFFRYVGWQFCPAATAFMS
jgi:hypothetical protein